MNKYLLASDDVAESMNYTTLFDILKTSNADGLIVLEYKCCEMLKYIHSKGLYRGAISEENFFTDTSSNVYLTLGGVSDNIINKKITKRMYL